MDMAYVSVYIGDQNRDNREKDLKKLVGQTFDKNPQKTVYILGKNEWGSDLNNKIKRSEKINYEMLKSVHDSILFFDQASYSDQDKNIIRRICILAPMHENRVVVGFSDLDKKGVFEKTILKLCKKIYGADPSFTSAPA